MLMHLGVLVLALAASGCRATVAPSDDTPQEDPRSSSPQLLTADELNAIAPEDALRVDLSRSGSAVRFDESRGPFDLSRVLITLGTGEVTSADAVAGIASVAFGKPISMNHASFRALASDSQRLFRPDPSCSNPLPIGCCVCGSAVYPCPVLVCVDPRSMHKTTITSGGG
jgi:hypothetical protein